MNNSNAIFLLVAGLPGVGKSTLARALGEELHWHIIDKDKLKKELLEQGLESEVAGYEAYEQAFERAYQLLSWERKSVILDSAALQKFIAAYAKEIVSALSHVQLKVILCIADRDLRNERLRNRPPQITTIYADPATIADYFQIFQHLPENTLVLYTNQPLKGCIEEAKKYLGV